MIPTWHRILEGGRGRVRGFQRARFDRWGVSCYATCMETPKPPSVVPDPPNKGRGNVQMHNKSQIGFLIPETLRQKVEEARFPGESLTTFCIEGVRRELAHRASGSDILALVERLSTDLAQAVARMRAGKGVEL
jgi:hypothetical protein